MLSSLVKRGFVTVAQTPPNDDSHTTREIIAKAIILGTLLVYTFAGSLISYVYGEVIATLTIVEDPSTTTHIIVDSGSDDPGAPLLSPSEKAGSGPKVAEPELHLVRNRPITSSFRATLHHLRSRDGRFGALRGISIRIVYCTFVALFTGLMSWLPTPAAAVIAAVLYGKLDLAWNNIVISEGSPKYWFRRLPSSKAWFKVIPAATLYAIADQLVVVLPTQLARMNGFMDLIDNMGHVPADAAERRAIMHALCRSGLAVFVVGVVLSILVQIPAGVTLTRVQASLLPETEKTIVPFDRTFGGKVVPEAVGGSGVVGMVDAWRSFGWPSRIRLLKVYAKVGAIQVALFASLVIIFYVEVIYFLPEFASALRNMADGPNQTVQIT